MVSKRAKQVDYEAKSVELAGRRYIVCRNHHEAQKDATDRASIVAALQLQLAKGDKALVGDTGYRRYLTPAPRPGVSLAISAAGLALPPTVRPAVND